MTHSAARLGDMASDHDGAPPTRGTEASPNVTIDGIPAMRQGDAFESHACPDESEHSRTLAGGSGSVFINGKPAGRMGDTISCGGTVVEGSPTVMIGD